MREIQDLDIISAGFTDQNWQHNDFAPSEDLDQPGCLLCCLHAKPNTDEAIREDAEAKLSSLPCGGLVGGLWVTQEIFRHDWEIGY